MSTVPSSIYTYYVGGSLPVDAPSYVYRQADRDLYESLRNGDFCYVLNARQMGKSSLRVRTEERLKAQDVACATIDITSIGTSDITPEQWYFGVIDTLINGFELYNTFDSSAWWEENRLLSPVQKFSRFLKDILLAQIGQAIVIFVDEIDSVLSLPFNIDDFFAVIRDCYNNRANQLEYRQLTFALIGVATPSDLIQDKRRTPFNIGRAIELTGFSLHEAEPLLPGLATKAEDSQSVLREILAWTGGQPFLTQKVCRLVMASSFPIAAGAETDWVANLMQNTVIDRWETQDEPEHLKTIRNRILYSNAQRTGRLLGLYQQVFQRGSVTADDSPEQMELRLSGLVVRQEGRLQIYNLIYAAVFDLAWVDQELANLRPYAETFSAWVESGFTDESRLLRGQALVDAQSWATNKSLSNQDYHFLDASRSLERSEFERNLDVEKQSNQLLTSANRKARKRIRFGVYILITALALAMLAGWWGRQSIVEAQSQIQNAEETIHSNELQIEKSQRELSSTRNQTQRQIAQAKQETQAAQAKINQAKQQQQLVQEARDKAQQELRTAQQERGKLQGDLQQLLKDTEAAQMLAQQARAQAGEERQKAVESQQTTQITLQGNAINQLGNVALQQFESGELESLLTAIQSGTALQELVKSQGVFDKSPAFSPLLALQKILDNISEQNQLLGHQGWVRRVRFSPDGRLIATAGSDGVVKLWDVLGQPIKTFERYHRSILDMNFSSTGRFILTAGDDGVARQWNLSGEVLNTYDHQEVVQAVVISSDEKRVVTVGGGIAKVWNIAGQQQASWQASEKELYSINFKPNDQSFITAGLEGKVQQWDWSGRKLIEFASDQGAILSAQFAPDGRTLATAGSDGSVKLWDQNGQPLLTLKAHKGWTRDINFSSDSQSFATAGDDGIVKLWNISGQQIAELKGHLGGVLNVQFNSNNQQLVSAGTDGTARLWNLSGQRFNSNSFIALSKSQEPENDVRCVSLYAPGLYPERVASALFDDNRVGRIWLENQSNQVITIKLYHPDLPGEAWGEFLVEPKATWLYPFEEDAPVFGSDWGIQVDSSKICILGRVGEWSLLNSRHIFKTSSNRFPKGSSSGNQNIFDTLDFSPDGQQLVTGELSGKVSFWDLSGRKLREWKAIRGGVQGVSFSPDGRYVATSSPQRVLLWNMSGEKIAEYSAYNVSFSGNGEHLAIATQSDSNDVIQIWHQATDQLIKEWNPSLGTEGKISVYSMDFSPDTKSLLIAGTLQVNLYSIVDSPIQLWDLSGNLITEFKGHRGGVLSAKFSPDGQAIVTGGMDGTVRLWGSLGEQLSQWKAHRGWVRSVMFLDNRRVASVGDDGLVKVWTRSGQLTAEFKGHRSKISGMAFDSSKQIIATSSYDGSVRLWQIENLDELISRSCDWIDAFEKANKNYFCKKLSSGD
ncbi:MAG: AAA-like domain-containing protein [Drouetiella hepatica Uher 2000/2452]|jgi:WD40 repeat protein|uniref:AAA-like domain-containing protein n=1 Tax=Drouetiella hepatica Uher 2000/2452 TaxID=904376 RepID=A0A951QBI4_9CYAN|nr:AAA-like domain-containing protein [Drouetiella hepatica Uher 2000/2452]